ncbi:MAG: 50S ribosomal protein L11 methyltransferase [Bacteroidales bacterium]|nr:50S ribosomal protein L11 methyltransferase [Bacteroidales bacterium]
MKYIQLAIKITPFDDTVTDILSFHLGSIGYDSFYINKKVLEAYIPEKDFSEEELKETLRKLSKDLFVLFNDIDIKYDFNLLEDENWNEEWEKNYFEPLVLSEKCLVRSSFHKVDKQYDYEITIDPKMAFGTGHHQTTYLMLQEILKLDLKDKAILDIGCGTAVLAVLASKMGAKYITAIDFDEWAYENAKENVLLNDISNVDVMLGEVDLVTNEEFDFIFANINRNVLLQDIKHYSKSLNNGGVLIMSGFYFNDVSAIKEECEKHGLSYKKTEQKDKWCAVLCAKS